MKCIYCEKENPLASFTRIEHVIPESFGSFRNNFTLKNIVCDDCNQYFGDNLEIALGRDTLEGASRFELGIKKPEEFKSFGKISRIIIKVAEGEFKGAYAYKTYSKEKNNVVINPVPQIGFLKKMTPDYEYFSLDQIPEKSYFEENSFDLKHSSGIRILGIGVDTGLEALAKKGIKFEIKGEVRPSKEQQEEWICEVEGTIDSIIFRAIAKIALNYLAYWEGGDFPLHDSFNPIRKFIRHNEICNYPLVIVDNNPILGDEPVEGKRRLGHILTVDWASDKVSIVSKVALFNWVTYTVSLARDFSGERRNIRNGHFFNTQSREILELEARQF